MSEFNESGGINPEELGINNNNNNNNNNEASPDVVEDKELNKAQTIKKQTYDKASLSAKTVKEKDIVLPSMKDLEFKGTGFGA